MTLGQCVTNYHEVRNTIELIGRTRTDREMKAVKRNVIKSLDLAETSVNNNGQNYDQTFIIGNIFQIFIKI